MKNIGIFNETKENIPDLEVLEPLLKYALDFEINKQYRGVDRPTDVISFALEDFKDITYENNYRVLGDIYISIDKVKEQAKEYGHSEKRELAFLAVHGLLHLLGYDHMKEDEEKIMFEKQEKILNGYGITKES